MYPMDRFESGRKFAAFALVSCLALFATPGSALDLTTSGDLCAPVNVGKANRNIQNVRGVIQNTSTTESIAVSCPVISDNWDFLAPNVGTTVQVLNMGDDEKEFKCVLREKDLNNSEVGVVVQKATLGAGEWFLMQFSGIAITDPTSRWNVTCLLPPESGVGYINMWNAGS